jgi:hypothetical protein
LKKKKKKKRRDYFFAMMSSLESGNEFWKDIPDDMLEEVYQRLEESSPLMNDDRYVSYLSFFCFFVCVEKKILTLNAEKAIELVCRC